MLRAPDAGVDQVRDLPDAVERPRRTRLDRLPAGFGPQVRRGGSRGMTRVPGRPMRHQGPSLQHLAARPRARPLGARHLTYSILGTSPEIAPIDASPRRTG